MEIQTTTSAGSATLALKGRLDASWADHVASALEQVVRSGVHHVDMDFSAVDYLSSAGLRVLLQFHKRLTAINGSLRVVRPGELVARTLTLSGFDALLGAAAPVRSEPASAPEVIRTAWGSYSLLDQCDDAAFACEMVGNPAGVTSSGFTSEQARVVSFPEGTLGLGLGAFGPSFAECQSRFGEFLACGGAALTLPTDGSSIPDHVLTNGNLVPELQVLYGARAVGRFSRVFRFDSRSESGAGLPLSDLSALALELCASPTVCLAIVAECGALVGAALRKSPALTHGPEPLAFPAVRDWLSFTTERGRERQVAVVAGLVSTTPDRRLEPLLRPFSSHTQDLGHFHAAVFAYRPLPRYLSRLPQAVATLIEMDSAQNLLHLLADDRPFDGVGESEFFRGTCWAAPVTQVSDFSG